MSTINAVGLRNEHWRKKLAEFHGDPRYARLLMTNGVQNHPRGFEAICKLLKSPAQMDDDINPWGDCDMLKLTLDGTKFYLKVDCYSSESDMDAGSNEPENDEKTTRVFTVLLADEY